MRESIKLFGYEKSIVGTWEQINDEESDRYLYYAEVDDTITIYAYDKYSQMLYVYFAGNFDNTIDINKEYVIASNNFKEITDDIEKASHIPRKEIVYKNNTLNFEGDCDGEYSDVVLQKTEDIGLPLIKYFDKRVSSKEMNNKIKICGRTIYYPDYFDVVEENSKIDILDNIKNDEVKKKRMVNNTFYSLHPSDSNAYAEMFFGNYCNADIKTIDDLREVASNSAKNYSETYVLLETKEFKISGMDAIMQIYYGSYYDPSDDINKTFDSIAYDTFIDIKERNEVLDIGVSYGYKDVSNNDYIGDYKKVLEKAFIEQ